VKHLTVRATKRKEEAYLTVKALVDDALCVETLRLSKLPSSVAVVKLHGVPTERFTGREIGFTIERSYWCPRGVQNVGTVNLSLRAKNVLQEIRRHSTPGRRN
jgi:hypothetical protein